MPPKRQVPRAGTPRQISAYVRVEILRYSRSRGLFAGISLDGSTLRSDNDVRADVYGRKITVREIVLGNRPAVPASGRLLVRFLQKNAPHNESEKASNR